MGEDLADVVTATAEDGVEGVTDRALESASGKAAIGLHVADLRFDGAAPPEEPLEPWREATACAADEHRRVLHTMAAVAVNDHSEGRLASGEGLDRLESVGKRLPL
jgi:hypothetical protein